MFYYTLCVIFISLMEDSIKLSIIEDYTKNDYGIYDICSKYHIGKIKAKSIFNEYNVSIRKRGRQNTIERNYDLRENKYIEEDGYHYEAIDRFDGYKTMDYMNRGGFLTLHIRKFHNVDIPSLNDRKKYYMKTGDYWYEQWFDIIRVKNDESMVKKCPFCDWKTIDVENKSGSFKVHLKEQHELSVEDYLNEFPDEIDYFKKYKRSLENEKLYENKDNYVICPICGKKAQKITDAHLRNIHGISIDEFKQKYPNSPILSERAKKQIAEAFKDCNLHISKNRFVSKYEKEIQEFLSQNWLEFSPNRQILIGKEIDIVIPNNSLCIEFDGLKFHTENFGRKDKNYHLNKTLKCNENGYDLIHIFEDEYVNHKDIVYYKLISSLDLYGFLNEIDIANVSINEIENDEANKFLEKYSIDDICNCSFYVGCYHLRKLVSVIGVNTKRNKNYRIRTFGINPSYKYEPFFIKMIEYLINNYGINTITIFSDRRWLTSRNRALYESLGFTLDNVIKPTFKYYNDRVNKYKRFNKNEIDNNIAYDKVWDCGYLKYMLKLDNMTTEDALVKIKEVHGDRYKLDSNWKYVNAKTKFNIYCKKHGFFIKDFYHFVNMKQGCPICSRGIQCKEYGYWNNKEHCIEEAKKYNNKWELNRKNSACYRKMLNNGWIDEIANEIYDNSIHYMKYDEKINYVYAYIFENLKTFYVGRTNNIKRRDKQHRNGHRNTDGTITYDCIYNFAKEHNTDIPMPTILEEKLTAEESQLQEDYWKNEYIRIGYYTLNKGTTGLRKGFIRCNLKMEL